MGSNATDVQCCFVLVCPPVVLLALTFMLQVAASYRHGYCR
jgi:hypothetical protein